MPAALVQQTAKPEPTQPFIIPAAGGRLSHYLEPVNGRWARAKCSASSSQPTSLTTDSALDISERYGQATVRLVTASTVSFGLLLLPQILQNSIAMNAGDFAALSILSWVVGILTT